MILTIILQNDKLDTKNSLFNQLQDYFYVNINQKRIIYMKEQEQQELREFIIQKYPQNQENIDLSVWYQKPIFTRGVQIMIEIVTWPIVCLNLSLYKLGDTGMQQLIRVGSRWPLLKELNVKRNQISCEGLKDLWTAQWNEMQQIVLSKNRIKKNGFAQIIKAKWLKLKHLWLYQNELRTDGAKLFPTGSWKELRTLSLRFNLIGNEGLKYLSYCKMEKLVKLEIESNRIDAKGVFYLLKMNLPELNFLSLGRNNIGKQNDLHNEIGCIYLSRIKLKNGLKFLNLFGNSISLEGIRIILYEMKFQENCFLQLIRNEFNYSDIAEDLKKLNYFCNYFE